MVTSRDLARSLAEGLAAAGVTRMFGVPGGGPNLDMIGAAAECGIDFVLAHGETAACIMAASYGLVTGTPGVAIVTRGPGFTSAVNGMAQATLDRFPLLLISDGVPAATAGRTAHQRLDQVSTAAPITKWSGVLGSSDPVGVVAAAAALACTAPAGAVHLVFDPTSAGDPAPVVPVRPEPRDPQAFERARSLVAAASHPVVLIGLDAVPFAPEVRAALQGFNAPMLTTYQAKGVIGESWPQFAGLFTGAAIERDVLERADLIIGIGLDSVEPVPGPWDYAAPMVLLHSYTAETAYFANADLGEPVLVTGGYGDDLRDLLTGCVTHWQPGFGRETNLRNLARLESPSDGLTPQETVLMTQQVLDGALLTVDAGAHMLPAMPLWQTDEASSVLISNGLATMGFSIPAGIGLALANPGRRVVCLVGDGGLGMVLAELETIARLGLDLTVVVLNDATLSLIKLKQGEGQGGARAVDYRLIDFAQVASGLGLASAVVTSATELKGALEATSEGPVLIDARVDAAAYAHIISVIRGR